MKYIKKVFRKKQKFKFYKKLFILKRGAFHFTENSLITPSAPPVANKPFRSADETQCMLSSYFTPWQSFYLITFHNF